MRDDGLERAFARADPWAFEEAYGRFGSRLYAVALRVTRNEAFAQECVHDVFLRLWRAKRAYDVRRGNLEAFLAACVRNEALSRMRKDARRREIDRTLTVEDSYELKEDPYERERVARAMERLSPAQARSLQLAYFKGMTFAEVAGELGEPLGTVKSRISSALRALRSALSEGNP